MIGRLPCLLLVATPAWACMCMGDNASVKEAWARAPLVFVGTVEAAIPEVVPGQTIFQEQAVRISVDEAFKGVKAGDTIELHESADECSAKFRTGERAVFYLYEGNSPGTWVVRPCTHSLGGAAPGGDDLLFLRNLPRSNEGTRLSGQIRRRVAWRDDAVGIPNVRVSIHGVNGVIQETATNSYGTYEVFGLPPGRYSVKMTVPHGLKEGSSSASGYLDIEGDPASVNLKPNGGSSVSFLVNDDTRVSGRLVSSKGESIEKVCLELVPAQGPVESGGRHYFNCTKEDGAFQMESMPPGEYLLLAEDEAGTGTVKSKSTLYYPGVRSNGTATKILISGGLYNEGLEMRVPGDERRRMVSGRLNFADGTPAKGATVMFTSPGNRYSETVSTGQGGSPFR